MNMLYLLTKLVSTTLHSILARHSATNGALTCSAAAGVRPKVSNLSTSSPEQLPMSTTLEIRSTVGIAITHSRVLRKAVKLWFAPLTRQPIRGGSNSIIMCQLIVMMFALPL
jgi:hypothetical protein